MFYSNCKKCGETRRFLTIEESKDPEAIKKNRETKITREEVENAPKKSVVKVMCLPCTPKKKKKAAEETE
jgi:hypothetical protein